MDNVVLSNKENELYSIVLGVQGTMEEKAKQLRDKGVYDKYKKIHSTYASNSDRDLESIKRGLFIQWYALCEPSCFTGINELELKSELKIIGHIDKLITNNNLDSELKWMLKYYSNWSYVFERFEEFNGLQNWIKNQIEIELPSTVDREQMQNRGQMGKYWSSIKKIVN